MNISINMRTKTGGIVLFFSEFGGRHSLGVGQELDGHDALSELAGGEILHVVTPYIHAGQVGVSVGNTSQVRSGVCASYTEHYVSVFLDVCHASFSAVDWNFGFQLQNASTVVDSNYYLFSKFSHFPQQTYVSLMEEIEAADSVDAIYAFVVSLSVCEGTPPGSLGLAVVFL